MFIGSGPGNKPKNLNPEYILSGLAKDSFRVIPRISRVKRKTKKLLGAAVELIFGWKGTNGLSLKLGFKKWLAPHFNKELGPLSH